MLKNIILKLLGISNQKQDTGIIHKDLGGDFYIAYSLSGNGMGGYTTTDLYLRKASDPTFHRCIINNSGVIQKFPGFQGNDWRKDLQFPSDHKVRFSFSVYGFSDGFALVSWTLQPDGRYFEDEDGFGAENCEEIVLYSKIDENGLFTEPFHTR